MRLTPAGRYQVAMHTLQLARTEAWALDAAGLGTATMWARVTAAADLADELRRKYERSAKRKASRVAKVVQP